MLATPVKFPYRSETPCQERGEQFLRLSFHPTYIRQVLDENGCLLDVNDAWLQTMGYTRKEVIGRRFADFLDARDICLFSKNLLCVGRIGQVIRFVVQMVRKDRTTTIVSFNSIISLDDYGIFRQTHCTIKEMTHFSRLNANRPETEYRDETKSILRGEKRSGDRPGRHQYRFGDHTGSGRVYNKNNMKT